MKEPDLKFTYNGAEICFWWDHMLQSIKPSLQRGDIFCVEIQDGIWWYEHIHTSGCRSKYSCCEWFRKNEKLVMDSYASYLLEKEMSRVIDGCRKS